VRELKISENRIGARLENSDVELTQNRFVSNEIGVELSKFTGVLRDNALFQNTLNLRAEAGTLLEANYWGSLDPAALRIEGGVVGEALNRPAPEGKVVTLRVSPCAGLTAEACQQKTAEAMIEGGRLFRAKNYGRALSQFETAIAAQPSADAYYFAAICHQEMQEEEPALIRLRDGVGAFPTDPSLRRALGMLYLQRGDEKLAREHLGEALRLSPNDRQAAFILERLGGAGRAKALSEPTGTRP
jgi:tetratricopeptide (TPR) repeat protein